MDKPDGVVCTKCKQTSAWKYHMAKSGFSPLCNKCRRKDASRKAQRKYWAKKSKTIKRQIKYVERTLLDKLDQKIHSNLHSIMRYEAKIMAGYQRPSHRQEKMQASRKKTHAYYLELREIMVADILRGNPKPFIYYTDQEDLLKKHFGVKHGDDTRSKG